MNRLLEISMRLSHLFVAWFWYVVVQLIMLLFMVAGWVVLIPPCLLHAWYPSAFGSISDGRVIDRWSWWWLSAFQNPEDGVSGQQALIWTSTGQVPYMPNAPAWWRAYCWSAWRNSCDNMKYLFAWERGPQATIFGHKLGWWPENNQRVPLL